MGTLFSQLAASARAAHAHFFGQADLTLKVPGQADVTVTAVLGNPKTETRREENKTIRVTVRECRFLSITDVRHDAVVVADGFNWAIDEIMDRQASHLTVKLQRMTAHQINRTNYRGK